jgi:hypothetical protein
VFSIELVRSIISIVSSQDTTSLLIVDHVQLSQQPMHEDEDDQNLGPAIHLPEEDEFLGIVKKAVLESRLYEPFTLLEKRVVHSICIEKRAPPKVPENPNKEEFDSFSRSEQSEVETLPMKKLALIESKNVQVTNGMPLMFNQDTLAKVNMDM